jgi:hypothetical protein
MKMVGVTLDEVGTASRAFWMVSYTVVLVPRLVLETM